MAAGSGEGHCNKGATVDDRNELPTIGATFQCNPRESGKS